MMHMAWSEPFTSASKSGKGASASSVLPLIRTEAALSQPVGLAVLDNFVDPTREVRSSLLTVTTMRALFLAAVL